MREASLWLNQAHAAAVSGTRPDDQRTVDEYTSIATVHLHMATTKYVTGLSGMQPAVYDGE